LDSETDVMDRPWRTVAEIHQQLGYKSIKAAQNAVSAGRFPVETYLLAGKRVVDVEVVNAFFAAHREKGLKQLTK
jgi:hypothetical protein